MDNRRHYAGRTLVYSDRYGPAEFWRGGVQVGCVCDPDTGVKCTYHARIEEETAAARARQEQRAVPRRGGRSRKQGRR
jgi:hypothetical protein